MKTFFLSWILIVTCNLDAQVKANAGLDHRVCLFDFISLEGSGLNQGDSGTYSWKDLNNQITYPNTNPLQIYLSDTGEQIFILTVEKIFGGNTYIDQDTVVVYVNPKPEVIIDLHDTLCASVPVFLKTKSTLTDGGTWSGNGISGHMLNPAFTPQMKPFEGPYFLYYFYSDTVSTCEIADTFSYMIQSSPQVIMNNRDTFRMCEGNILQLTGSSLKFSQGSRWYTDGDGVFSSPDQLQTLYIHGLQDTVKGYATLFLTSVTMGICPASIDSMKLILEAFPQFEMIAINPIQCEPAIVQFKVNLRKPLHTELQYDWWFGNGDSLTINSADSLLNVKYDHAGQAFYPVKLKVSRRWGNDAFEQCAISQESNNLVRILPQPKADFYTSPGFFTTSTKPEFRFTNTTTSSMFVDQLKYHWQFSHNGQDTSTAKHPSFRYTQDTGLYKVTLMATYLYFYNGGIYSCQDEIIRLVKVGLPVDCIKIFDRQLLNRSIQVYFPFEGHFVLIDASGRILIKQEISNNLIEDFDIGDWTPGVYTFYIYNGKEECARKFIKY